MGQRTHFLVNEVWQSVMTMEFTGPTTNYLTQKIFSLIEYRTFSWRHSYEWDIWPLRMWFVPQSYGHYILLATQQEEGRGSGTRGRNRSGSAHHYSQWPISCSLGYVFMPSFGSPSLGVLPEPQTWSLLARQSAHCWALSTYKGLKVPENLCSYPFRTSTGSLGVRHTNIAPLPLIGTTLRLSFPSGPPWVTVSA